MILVAMTPSPEEIFRCHTEECIVFVERGQAFPALKKIRLMAFSADDTPSWITSAIKYLSLTDFGDFSFKINTLSIKILNRKLC
jgi:hypothetical protein